MAKRYFLRLLGPKVTKICLFVIKKKAVGPNPFRFRATSIPSKTKARVRFRLMGARWFLRPATAATATVVAICIFLTVAGKTGRNPKTWVWPLIRPTGSRKPRCRLMGARSILFPTAWVEWGSATFGLVNCKPTINGRLPKMRAGSLTPLPTKPLRFYTPTGAPCFLLPKATKVWVATTCFLATVVLLVGKRPKIWVILSTIQTTK